MGITFLSSIHICATSNILGASEFLMIGFKLLKIRELEFTDFWTLHFIFYSENSFNGYDLKSTDALNICAIENS